MRADMKHLLKDRRGRSYEEENFWSRTRMKRVPSSELPKRIPFGRSWLCRRGNSNPLENFLYSKIGQIWDDVYSEICEATDRRSDRGRYLFQQLKWMVETAACKRRWRGFYVEDRVLKYHEGFKYMTKIVPVTHLSLDFKLIALNYKGELIGDWEQWFELIDGHWYWVEPTKSETWYQYFLWEKGVHCDYDHVTKRQVGKRTLKKIRRTLHGL